MEKKKQYNGLDIMKVIMAVLVAARHMIQLFYPAESKWRLVIGAWLSNLAVPVFFITAGFFLFNKVDRNKKEESKRALFKYGTRILNLYVIWSVIYLPIDYINWKNGPEKDIQATVLNYIKSFFFCSTTVQLWYLPALLTACLLVAAAYMAGVRISYLLIAGALLFAAGCIGDNWYFNQQLPMGLQQALHVYAQYFMTMRNGIFYGFFFVAIGLWFSKSQRNIPFVPAMAGSGIFLACMLCEVLRCSNTNMVFMSAPAAFFLFAAASSVNLKNRKLYPRLRMTSEWIYLSHVYFFHFYGWVRRWNPLPATKKGITISILGPMILFSWCMACLSAKKAGRWLKKLV